MEPPAMSVKIRNGLVAGASVVLLSLALRPEDAVEQASIVMVGFLIGAILDRFVFPKLRAWRDSI